MSAFSGLRHGQLDRSQSERALEAAEKRTYHKVGQLVLGDGLGRRLHAVALCVIQGQLQDDEVPGGDGC